MNDFFSETDPHTIWRGNDYDKTLVEFAIEPVNSTIAKTADDLEQLTKTCDFFLCKIA